MFLGWGYPDTSADNRLPVIQGHLPAGLLWTGDGVSVVDCSTFANALAAYCTDADWDAQAYYDGQVMGADDLWSAPKAWARCGAGELMAPGEIADQWGLYQGWGSGFKFGHQWAYHGRLGVRFHSSRSKGGPRRDRISKADLAAYYKAGIQGVRL
jgi:hypothetical protein